MVCDAHVSARDIWISFDIDYHKDIIKVGDILNTDYYIEKQYLNPGHSNACRCKHGAEVP